ncbi:MAG: thiol-disulfide oxidoreductase DCC family protein [Methylophilaceae bacterium]|tara:strand:+ start:792 stop:1172 length:381 start_codon:yes stop_codon:yes gene_type:complete
MLSVFYDDRCKICSKEINFYKKIAPKNSLNWLGISSSKLDLKLANIKLVDALLYLHVKDSEGNFYIGVDAFIVIWKKLPYFKYLNLIISLPIIYPLAKYLYKKFAKYRFNKLKHCQIAFEEEKKKQ